MLKKTKLRNSLLGIMEWCTQLEQQFKQSALSALDALNTLTYILNDVRVKK